tara:strand:- start:5 stop:2371 length:2367 start_codon:yes stop_codon:yes gene_type:complete
MTAEEQLNKIKQLPDLDDLREEYEKEEDKNEFILVEFGDYIDDAGDSRSRKKLIEMINELMREGRSGVQEDFEAKVVLDKINFTGMQYKGEDIAEKGGKLKEQFVSLLSNTIIDVNKITVKDLNPRIKQNKEAYKNAKLQVEQVKVVKESNLLKNFINIYDDLLDRQQYNLGKRELDLDFDLSDFFSASTLRQLSQRNNVYKYWKGIHEKIEELKKELRKTDLIKDEIIDNINYIHDFKKVKFNVDALEYRAYDFVKSYIGLVFGSDIIDLDEVDGEYYFAQRGTKTEDGDKAQSGEIDSTKVLSTKLKRALQTTKEMDVLGYLHIVTNLSNGSYALSSDELKLLKTKIKDLFNSYIVQINDEFIESMNDGLKNLLDSFKIVNTARTYHYLPIYFASNKESMIRYKNLQIGEVTKTGKSGEPEKSIDIMFDEKKITNAINEMIKIISEAIVEEKGATPINIREEGKGVGGGGRDADKEVSFYTASVRGKLARYKDIDKDMEKILKLIDDCYIRPFNSKFGKGISLGYDETLLGDLTNRPDSPFAIKRQLNENYVKEGLDFINLDELNDIKEFMILNKQIESKTTKINLDELKRVFLEMADEMDDIIDTSEAKDLGFTEMIIKDIASLFYHITKEDTSFEGVSSKAAFDERGATTYDDSHAFKQIVYFLIGRIDEFNASNMKSEAGVVKDIKKLQDWFGDIKKSEEQMLLQAHDHIRVLKGQDVHFDVLDYNDIDDMEYFITKMNKERNIDLSSMEVYNIVKELDSFQNISNEYGISTEDVYLIKANFR